MMLFASVLLAAFVLTTTTTYWTIRWTSRREAMKAAAEESKVAHGIVIVTGDLSVSPSHAPGTPVRKKFYERFLLEMPVEEDSYRPSQHEFSRGEFSFSVGISFPASALPIAFSLIGGLSPTHNLSNRSEHRAVRQLNCPAC